MFLKIKLEGRFYKMKNMPQKNVIVFFMVFLLVSIFTSCYQRSGSGGTSVSAKNPLANTTWESDEQIIVFGENSFRIGGKESNSPITGTYSISGDAVILDYSVFGISTKSTGSLIGDTLSVLLDNFKRVK
jgi:hypothetical protein